MSKSVIGDRFVSQVRYLRSLHHEISTPRTYHYPDIEEFNRDSVTLLRASVYRAYPHLTGEPSFDDLTRNSPVPQLIDRCVDICEFVMIQVGVDSKNQQEIIQYIEEVNIELTRRLIFRAYLTN